MSSLFLKLFESFLKKLTHVQCARLPDFGLLNKNQVTLLPVGILSWIQKILKEYFTDSVENFKMNKFWATSILAFMERRPLTLGASEP